MGVSTSARPIGFIGLGLMGEPMALNLVRAGTPLVVWNRSAVKSDLLAKAGALVAKDPQDIFRQCEVVILMLRDGAATDIVLGRQDPSFRSRVNGHTIINMATTSPHYSKALEADVLAQGGHYVEAPVSGSRKPAEAARAVHIASPLLDVCHALYAEADALLDTDLDMIAVIRAIEKRTAAIR